MASQKKIFDLRQNGAAPRNLPPPFELPNEQIKVEIKLMKHINNVDLQSLRKDLQNHNMDNVSVYPPKNITISGYPPMNGFSEHTVLAIVKRYDSHASLLPKF